MTDRLLVPADLAAAVVAHALAERPNECCGLLAGVAGRVLGRFPLVNELASPVAFRSEPRSLLAAHKAVRAAGWEVLAVYHSHPTTAAEPSRHDLEQSWSEAVACVIVSLAGPVPAVRAWRLAAAGATEVAWEVVPAG